MSNEHLNPNMPQDENWLDNMLGTETPKADISPEELSAMGDQITAENMDMDRIIEETWDTDQQTISEIQDSVAEELPTPSMDEQFTTRIPFADPVVTIAKEEVADRPTMAIPTSFFAPPQAFDLTDAPAAPMDGTQQFAVPQDAPIDGTQQFTMPADMPIDGTQQFTMPQEFTQYQPNTEEAVPQPQYQPLKEPVQEEKPAPKKAAEPMFTPPEELNPQQDKPAEEALKKEKEPKQPKEKKVRFMPKVEDNGKGRPARKKGYGLFGIPHIASTIIWLTIIVVAGVSLGRMLWVCCADVMAFGKPDREITITITTEDVKELEGGAKEVNIDAISQKLGDAGLIKYPNLFKMFAKVTGKDEHISPGTYTLNCYFDYNAMINAMSSYEKAREIVTVLIPEGYNCAQLFALLEAYEVCTIEELEECAAKGNETLGEYWFLTDEIPWGEKYCLEGYLFPDTYEFYTNDDPANVLNKMLSNFDARFTDKMKADLENIKARYGISLHEVLTIASMVEEEAVGATKATGDYEGYQIASVYYNRLTNKNGQFPDHMMGCDATVYYAMGDYFGTTEELTQEHLNTDSPYNTRRYGGLPPGPITNPGSYSMYAALDPDETDLYFYVYDPEQKCHVFAHDEAEFEQIKKDLGY